ncbi:MAG: ABC transporter ATP-binding protein [Actinomycetota bacterium]|nr:MAG: ABC transporter ATP-binding protein [Actinomycetota bacterium]
MTQSINKFSMKASAEPNAINPTSADLTGHDGTVDVRGLTVCYTDSRKQKHTVLQDVSFNVPSGTFATVIGPSGSGKSTLLKILGGLHPAEAGETVIGGRLITEPNPDLVTIVFQDSSLLPWRTVIRNVALPLETAGVNRLEREERAQKVLELVGLGDCIHKYPRELSGGMKQRVAIARGLVVEPSVLLMDEPFAALDEQSRYEMGEELLKLWDRLKSTVIFVTHNLSEAVFLADKVIVLEGRPATVGQTVDVNFSRPRDLGLMVSPEFHVVRDQLYTSLKRDRIRSSGTYSWSQESPGPNGELLKGDR